MHDSCMPLVGMVPLFLIQLGEIIFGGVGSGLYGMLALIIVAVFVTALGSGLDPHIGVTAVLSQVHRVATARSLSEADVKCLVEKYTEGRQH